MGRGRQGCHWICWGCRGWQKGWSREAHPTHLALEKVPGGGGSVSASWCTGLLQGDRQETRAQRGKAKGQLGWEGAQGRISLSGLAAELCLLLQQLREDRESWSRAREGLGRTKVPPKKWEWAAGGDWRTETV